MVLRKHNNFNGHMFFLKLDFCPFVGERVQTISDLFAHDFPNIGRFLGPLEVPYVWTKPGKLFFCG